jgi:hypothetical protein
MGETAQVLSIDTLKTLYEGIVQFREDGKNALISVEMEARRATDFLNQQRVYWAEELKRRKEKLAMAQSELHKKKLQAKPGGAVQDSDQKEAVRVATQRVREAEAKIETVKKWVSPLQHAIDEYHGKSRPLGDMLEGEVEKSLGMLGRMIGALEEYVRLSPPPPAD